jgi:Mycothiol maleylpyruvate isomerase N-terminal domain
MAGSYIEENARELERMRRLVEGLDLDRLTRQVNDHWTVAAVLGHIAFWDARVLALAAKLDRGHVFTSDDEEPEDVDWINDSSSRFIHAVEPRALSELSLRIAEETDARVASLPEDQMFPANPESPIYAFRSSHRGEHLDEIEVALRS